MSIAEVNKQPMNQTGKSKVAYEIAFLGSPPLLPGESSAVYEQLLGMVMEEVKPASFREAIWARDIAYHEWSIRRLRKMPVDFIENSYNNFGMSLTGGTLARDESVVVRDRDFAEIAVQNIGALERLDRMVAMTEARRNSTYREIERHKSTLADRLQSASKQITDVEFNEVTTVVTTVPSSVSVQHDQP